MPNLKKNSNLPRVLAVGCEAKTLSFLGSALGIGEYSLHQADNGHAALAAAEAVRPDIILLEAGMPRMDGIEVIRRLREWSRVPIIVFSEHDGEDDKVEALDAGADDYLLKPFGAAELQARIRVSLKRSLQQSPEELMSCRGLEVDLTRRRAAWLGKEVQLDPTEYELLRLMLSHPGKMLTQSQILRQVWGANSNSKLIWSNRSQSFTVRL